LTLIRSKNALKQSLLFQINPAEQLSLELETVHETLLVLEMLT